jgi:hypothetical protein
LKAGSVFGFDPCSIYRVDAFDGKGHMKKNRHPESWSDLRNWFDSTWTDLISKEQKSGIDSLSPKELIFYKIYLLIGEVGNGGFDQYYYNPSGDHALATVHALQEIHAANPRILLERCNGLFPGGSPPVKREERIRALDQLSDDSRLVMDECSIQLMADDDLLIRLYHYHLTGGTLTDRELRERYPNLYGKERYFQRISTRPAKEQFHQLFNDLRLVMFGQRDRLMDPEINEFDIQGHIVKLPYFEQEVIVSAIADYIYRPQFNTKGTPEYKEQGAFTRESNLTHTLLEILARKGEPTDLLETRLRGWLMKLLEESRKTELAGLNLIIVARTMRSLWPSKYPEPVLGPKDNKLLNAEGFIAD